jgi:hypothetical protein
MATVCETLKAAIRANGSGYAAAKASGVNVSAVLRFLNGERDLKGQSIDKLCAALGLELKPVKKTKGR